MHVASPADQETVPALVLCLPRAELRHWHRLLVERLRAHGIATSAAWSDPGEPAPAGMEVLFALERTVRPRPSPRPSDRIVAAALALPDPDASAIRLVLPGARPDAGEEGDPGRVWRILFNGLAGSAALLQALLSGEAPVVEVVDGTGAVLARGKPAVEGMTTLCDAYDAVTNRLVSLIVMAARAPRHLSASPAISAHAPRALGRHALHRLSRVLLQRLRHLCYYGGHWRTGWRPARSGATVWETGTLQGEPWRVLPDPGHSFYADPFPFAWQGQTHVFVEDFDHRSGRAVISVLAFGPDGPRGPAIPVLDEPFHLSYPFILAHAGQIWMIPETCTNRTVSLYRADPYPSRWVHERDLLTDVVASDATVIRHGDRWWMFATLHDGVGGYSDMLGLFMADDLFGPWVPHPANPVLIDASMARPAGAMRVRDGRLWRPVQDCTRVYGGALALCEITTLTETRFEQSVRRRIGPGAGWPGHRLHTLNCAGGLEVIDGSAVSSRLFRTGPGPEADATDPVGSGSSN
jgi:hypothetical protein